MPNGATSPVLRAPPREAAVGKEHGLLARVRVYLRADKFDRALARGANPGDSAELGLRASQLVTPRERERIAQSIDGLLYLANLDRRSYLGWSRIPFDRERVRDNRFQLAELAETLRSRATPSAQGVAMARQLMTDFRGPIYIAGRVNRLREAIAETLSALNR